MGSTLLQFALANPLARKSLCDAGLVYADLQERRKRSKSSWLECCTALSLQQVSNKPLKK